MFYSLVEFQKEDSFFHIGAQYQMGWFVIGHIFKTIFNIFTIGRLSQLERPRYPCSSSTTIHPTAQTQRPYQTRSGREIDPGYSDQEAETDLQSFHNTTTKCHPYLPTRNLAPLAPGTRPQEMDLSTQEQRGTS